MTLNERQQVQIKIRSKANGDGATVWMVNPSSGETVDDSTRELAPGDELSVTAINAHDPSEIEIGQPEPQAEAVKESTPDEGSGEGEGAETAE